MSPYNAREQAARKFRGNVAEFIATFPDLASRCSVRVISTHRAFGPALYAYSVHMDRTAMHAAVNGGDNSRRPVVA